MKCSICGIDIPSYDAAIEAGWSPHFYEGDTEHELACSDCADLLLHASEDGEIRLKEEYRGKIIYQDVYEDEYLLVEINQG